MTKTEIWTKVQETLSAHKADEALINELAELLKPKAGGGRSQHPPKMDKDGNIVEAWCRYHQRYEPIEDMVVGPDGRSKGYCKAASWRSNNYRKMARELSLKAIEAMKTDIEEAQRLKAEADKYEGMKTNPEAFDYEKDWEDYRASKRPKAKDESKSKEPKKKPKK